MRRYLYAILLVTAWIAVFSVNQYQKSIPADEWLEVKSVFIHDTVVGIPPRMEVDRTIKQSFRGSWTARVDRRTRDSGFSFYCQASLDTNYLAEASLPDNLNLDWWTWPTKCTPKIPGEYRVDTYWVINPDLVTDKMVYVRSNVFRVVPQEPQESPVLPQM